MEFRIWPKNKWLSMIRLLLIGMLLILITEYLVYGRRAQIAAKVWHWRHGYSTYVGDYVVPVPDHWLVDTSEDNPRMINFGWKTLAHGVAHSLLEARNGIEAVARGAQVGTAFGIVIGAGEGLTACMPPHIDWTTGY
jgi:hypothetical protein